jgi:carbon-monoxide dehydrogenase large subunit
VRKISVRTYVGIGAYTSTFAAIFATTNTKNCLSSVYAIPSIHIGVKMVFTNAAPLGPYRGAGRRKEHFTIGAPTLLGRFDPERVEATG